MFISTVKPWTFHYKISVWYFTTKESRIPTLYLRRVITTVVESLSTLFTRTDSRYPRRTTMKTGHLTTRKSQEPDGAATALAVGQVVVVAERPGPVATISTGPAPVGPGTGRGLSEGLRSVSTHRTVNKETDISPGDVRITLLLQKIRLRKWSNKNEEPTGR